MHQAIGVQMLRKSSARRASKARRSSIAHLPAPGSFQGHGGKGQSGSATAGIWGISGSPQLRAYTFQQTRFKKEIPAWVLRLLSKHGIFTEGRFVILRLWVVQKVVKKNIKRYFIPPIWSLSSNSPLVFLAVAKPSTQEWGPGASTYSKL